jgi:hypothetical protein
MRHRFVVFAGLRLARRLGRGLEPGQLDPVLEYVVGA